MGFCINRNGRSTSALILRSTDCTTHNLTARSGKDPSEELTTPMTRNLKRIQLKSEAKQQSLSSVYLTEYGRYLYQNSKSSLLAFCHELQQIEQKKIVCFLGHCAFTLLAMRMI